MHFMKLVMGQYGMETSSLLESTSSEENRGFGSVKSAILNSATATTPQSSAASPSGVIGVGWSGASSSVVKHQHSSYRPATTTRSSSSSCRFADNNKLLSVFTLIGLILIFSNFSQMSEVAAMPRCPAAVENNEEPGDCSYGITTDYCGRKVCAKGPGQICGVGLFKLLGSCGEGLYCNCGRCTGCSLLTMECYDKTCV